MKPYFITLALVFSLASVSDVRGQDSTPSEGYIISLRSLYEAPDANSNTVGFLRPGEFVRLEHIHSLVYKVFRDDNTDVAGYVVYPKISEDKPTVANPNPSQVGSRDSSPKSTGSIRKASETVKTSGAVTNYSTVVRAASYGSTKWVHRTSNIRAGTGTDTPIVAQLPTGTAVRIGTTIGSWASVYRSTDEVLDPERALGFVHTSLLNSSPPAGNPVVATTPTTQSIVSSGTVSSAPVETESATDSEVADEPKTASILQSLSTSATAGNDEIDHSSHEHSEGAVVFVTKTGKKYHLETCRHLRKSKRQITLKEAKEKNFDACRTCKPDKKLAEDAESN